MGRGNDADDRATEPSAETHPAWITLDLIVETLRVWKLRSSNKLSEREAVDLILGFTQLFDAVERECRKEKQHD